MHEHIPALLCDVNIGVVALNGDVFTVLEVRTASRSAFTSTPFISWFVESNFSVVEAVFVMAGRTFPHFEGTFTRTVSPLIRC